MSYFINGDQNTSALSLAQHLGKSTVSSRAADFNFQFLGKLGIAVSQNETAKLFASLVIFARFFVVCRFFFFFFFFKINMINFLQKILSGLPSECQTFFWFASKLFAKNINRRY